MSELDRKIVSRLRRFSPKTGETKTYNIPIAGFNMDMATISISNHIIDEDEREVQINVAWKCDTDITIQSFYYIECNKQITQAWVTEHNRARDSIDDNQQLVREYELSSSPTSTPRGMNESFVKPSKPEILYDQENHLDEARQRINTVLIAIQKSIDSDRSL